MTKPTHRGVIHFHTHFSYDSLSSARRILQFARDNNLSFLICTDHGTIKGSLELRKLAAKLGLDIEIPIAAEYYTTSGDVIVAFIESEIRVRHFDELVDEVERQGGITLLPHPFRGHTNIEHLAERVTMIEVFNSRQEVKYDDLSADLAQRHGKPIFYGPDAHLVEDLGDVMVSLPGVADLKTDLVTQPVTALTLRKVDPAHLRKAKIIAVLKGRRFGLLFRWILRKLTGRPKKT